MNDVMKALAFFGAFNPPTVAHIQLAEFALRATGREKVIFVPSKAAYIKDEQGKDFAYTDGQVLRIDGTLNSFLLDTDDESFFRCSKSMVLNVNRVTSLKSLSSNRIDATMEGGEHIIISRRYASEFRKLLKGGRK